MHANEVFPLTPCYIFCLFFFLHIVLVGFSFHGWDNWDRWWIITTVLGFGEIRRKLLKYVITQCTVRNECLQLNNYLFMYITIDISKPQENGITLACGDIHFHCLYGRGWMDKKQNIPLHPMHRRVSISLGGGKRNNVLHWEKSSATVVRSSCPCMHASTHARSLLPKVLSSNLRSHTCSIGQWLRATFYLVLLAPSGRFQSQLCSWLFIESNESYAERHWVQG